MSSKDFFGSYFIYVLEVLDPVFTRGHFCDDMEIFISKSHGPISVSDENSKPDSSVTLSSNGECEYSD